MILKSEKSDEAAKDNDIFSKTKLSIPNNYLDSSSKYHPSQIINFIKMEDLR